jgi:hypothetical protein
VNADFWLSIVSICISLGGPAAIFVARNWLSDWISKGVQHGFDVKMEELRAEVRKNEERFKSDLRDREAEIATLRADVFAGSASRRSLLDKRRFEAAEKVWTAVNDLAQLKGLSNTMAILNFKAMAKEASNPKMQLFLSTIGGVAPDIDKLKNVARDERLFLPEIAWAYFFAYTTILYRAFTRFKVLRIGLDDADKYLTNDGTKTILKAALPHQSKWIDEHEPETYHFLLEEIEGYLLTELRKILEGKDADQTAATRAKQIMEAIKHADDERTAKAVTDVRGD